MKDCRNIDCLTRINLLKSEMVIGTVIKVLKKVSSKRVTKEWREMIM